MKRICFRTYEGNRMENGDYKKVHDFLVKTKCADYTYGRFDWMMTNWEYLEDQFLNRIGIWEKENQIVGVTLFDHSLDIIFPIVLEEYEYLYSEMLEYAKNNMVKEENPEFLIFANDNNEILIAELKKKGYIATEEKDMVAMFDLAEDIPSVNLPEGFEITSLYEESDYENYLLCMFKGFGHEEANETFHFDEMRRQEMMAAYDNRKYLDKSLKVFIKDKVGSYVATCGMWYDADSELALIEPVCVIPECRKLGLGREVVYEGLRRVKRLGAKSAVVGSSQQFYYSLGMIPYRTGTMWKPSK